MTVIYPQMTTWQFVVPGFRPVILQTPGTTIPSNFSWTWTGQPLTHIAAARGMR